jgi:uncharacterized repeat protein (TIGR01451 family)
MFLKRPTVQLPQNTNVRERKSLTRLSLLSVGLAGLVATITVFSGLASAVAAGQIEGGNIYRVRNVTKNTDFTDPATADKCETVQYRVRLHNPGPDPVTNVNVKASLQTAAATSHSSSVTVTGDNLNPATTTDTATLNLSASLGLSYVPGSTELLDNNAGVINGLPDTIFTSGVNVGSVGVSTQQIRYVQFKAVVECPQSPPPSTGVCKLLKVTISNKEQREVTASLSGETNNAQITAYRIDFGDSTVVNEQNATHRYANDGTYNIVGSVQVKYADGRTEFVTADSCKNTVTFKKEQPPVVTTTTSSSSSSSSSSASAVASSGTSTAASGALPNVGTGASSLIGLSTISTLLGSFLYRRHLLKQAIDL